MIIQNLTKCSDVIGFKPAAAVAALDACVVVSLEHGPSPKLILPASPNPIHPSKSPSLPSGILFAQQVWFGYRASDGIGLPSIPRRLTDSHGGLMGGICSIFPPERNAIPGRPNGLTCSFQDIKNRPFSHAELFGRLRSRKSRSIRSTYCGFVFGSVCSAGVPVRNQDHFCLLRKSSMARRINSETGTSSCLDKAFNFSSIGSGRNVCVRIMPIIYQLFNRKETTALQSAPFTPRPEGRGFSEQI